jgi:hypothetical protein
VTHLKRTWGISLILGVALLAWPWLAGAASAQSAAPCDPAVACFDVTLSPATLTGDFYLDGNLAASGVNSARLAGAPGAAHLAEVKNIQEPSAAGSGDLFVYPDQNRPNLSASGGAALVIPFWPQRNYVKGQLSYTCQPLGRQPADNVACRPTLDGAVQADVPAGATATYALPGGAHTLHSELVGDQASHWSPTTRDDAVTISTGRAFVQSTLFQARFTLQGVLKISLFPDTLRADLYVDGAQVAAQAAGADVFVAAGAHTVEAKALTEAAAPGFGDLFVYADMSQPGVYAGAAQTRPVFFRPQRSYVKGVLSYTCNPLGWKAADGVGCRPAVDGVAVGEVPAGATVNYTLPGGAHTVHTDLAGDQASNWSPITRDDAVVINAGRSFLQTTRLPAAFTLKGLLKISLWPKGLLADIYVDGALAAPQAAGAEVYVAAGAHMVEAKAVTDPAANGQYAYGTAAQSASVFAAGTRFVNLLPQKTWLVGFLKLNCQVNQKGAGDDVACAVSENGAPVGTVAAGQQGTLSLALGAHSLTVATAGAQAGKWDGPVTTPVTIWGGQTVYATARFNLRPAAAPAAAPSGGGQPGVNHLGTEKVVLADYMMWFGPDTFDGNKTWDVPASGPYNSDDFGTIQRHVAQAQQACLNGFAAHWFGPGDARTTNNFNSLLAASAGTNLRHAIVIQANILPGASEGSIIDAVNFVLGNWAQSPNYLRLGGRPVIVFTDMPRPWGSDAAAREGWARIRAATDPNHNAIWMAEGLHPTFNPLFDGLYVYRIDHRDYPQSWLKQSRWANELRAVERQGNLPIGGLYFADTIAAGFDDTRSVNAPGDLRSEAAHFARDRRNGAYYAETFAATAGTGGDFLFVKSYNEWIEGTEIEPGAAYGDLYLNLTCQYANAYRGR